MTTKQNKKMVCIGHFDLEFPRRNREPLGGSSGEGILWALRRPPIPCRHVRPVQDEASRAPSSRLSTSQGTVSSALTVLARLSRGGSAVPTVSLGCADQFLSETKT